jgi:site-specific recombinase XerD
MTRDEIEAVIAAPDIATWYGRRHLAILVLTLQTGLRVTELITLNCSDIELGAGAHVRCMGKGRKERATPIRKDRIKVLRDWLIERAGASADPLFVSNRGARLSRDAVERMVRVHVTTAGRRPFRVMAEEGAGDPQKRVLQIKFRDRRSLLQLARLSCVGLHMSAAEL